MGFSIDDLGTGTRKRQWGIEAHRVDATNGTSRVDHETMKRRGCECLPDEICGGALPSCFG
jgi:hypothetical protein